MEAGIDKDIGVFGGLFLTIVSELRASPPIWEDFISKATKLHTSLRSTVAAVSAFLDAFQKIADTATNSRGATKEIGSALTRLCMRHKSIENKLKKVNGTILEKLVTPLQECTEEWKKTVVQIDKEHAKEYKRAKQDIKKCAADTVRLQKKVKKATANGTTPTSPLWFDEGKQDMQNRLENAMQEVNDKYILLEEQEKNAVRTVMIEERSRYCHFVSCLKPFVDEEVGLLTEVTHLQEIMDLLCLQADNPHILPASSEQVINDLSSGDSGSFKFQTPPSSPSSLGSRKSSMCSINSIASSSSGSAQSHSPCHNKTIQQQQAQLLGSGVRLTSVSSQDSGFTSQDTLFLRPTTPSSLNLKSQNADSNSQDTDTPEVESTPSTPSESYPNTPSATSTWTNWPNPPNNTGGKSEPGRPHTISSAYEKSHSRPALSSQLFEPPGKALAEDTRSDDGKHDATVIKRERPHSSMSVPYSRQSASINKMQPVLPPLGPKPKSRAVAPPKVPPSIGEQPVYANLNDLNVQVQGNEADLDKTPTARNPPVSDMANGQGPKQLDDMDLTEAIRDLDNYTAALHGDFTPGDRKSKIEQNTLELAAAIKELEASTAALECSYSDNTQASQSSLSVSSGYGTMNSTPAGSEDTIASGDYLDTGQSEFEREEKEKYFTIPRNSPVIKAAFQFKRPASTAGIPVSAQGGAGLSRRSSLNTPKPPPPVRRSSSITSAPNSAVLKKYRNSPPRQLNTQPPQVSVKPGKMNAADASNNHRRSMSASGSNTENAYAELSEIQQSIAARQQHGVGYQQGMSLGYNPGVMSAPATPQYAQPVTIPNYQMVNSNVINSLNSQFNNMTSNSQQSLQSSQQQVMASQQHSANNSKSNNSGSDFPDLPPPPSEAELQEMEQVYSVPNQTVQQTQSYNVQHTQQQHSVQMRKQTPMMNPMAGIDMRQSLISEMKTGNKFRKMSTSEEDSQC